jgi:hypothetical protein
MFILEKSGPLGVVWATVFGRVFYPTILIVQFLNMFGVLSNLSVTLLYLFE